MDITQTILYRGLSFNMHIKKAFMRECLRYKPVMEKVANLLMKEEVSSKLALKGIEFEKGAQFCICEEDFDYLFDEMVCKEIKNDKIDKLPEQAQKIWLQYKDMFENNGQEVVLDVTNCVTYAMIKSQQCIECLYAEISEKQLYDTLLDAFEHSEYRTDGFEKCIDAKEISASRLIRGVLVLFREQKSEQLYRMIMKILNTGFSKIKKSFKHYDELDGDAVRQLQKHFLEEESFNTMLVACEQIVIYVMAEGVGKEVDWDFSLLSMAHYFKDFASELKGSTCTAETDGIIPETYKEALERVQEKYGSYDSVSELIHGSDLPDKLSYLENVMCAFQVSPRKFYEYKLTTQEVVKLMKQKEHWNTKDYMYCMILAIFCKYICTLEEKVAETDRYLLAHQRNQLVSHQENFKKLKSELETERKKWQQKWKEKEAEYSKVLLDQERQMEYMFGQEQNYRDIVSTYEQELKELRNYVYGVRQEWMEESDIDVEEQSRIWQNRKVIVFGGHVNWQRKLKEKFPKWQFVTADIKSFSQTLIYDKEYIICNTDFLSHASYYKIVAGRHREQRMLFVRSNNLGLCIKELCMQLRE